MNVKRILAAKEQGRAVISVAPDASVCEAAKLLAEHGIGALVVLDERQRLRGILSERDIVRSIAQEGGGVLNQPVADIMTPDPITARPGDTCNALQTTMTERRIRHLPVIDEGRLIGLISIGDVVKAKIDQAEHEAESMRTYIHAGP